MAIDSLPPMLLSSSPPCLLASADQRITSESREVKCARTPRCRRVQMLLQEERGMRLCSAHIQVCSCSSFHRNKPGHNSFNLPPSPGFTARLGIHCCNRLYVCTYPLHPCPWVGDNLPSFRATTALPLR